MKKALALIQKVQIAVAACFLLIFLVTIAFQMFSRFAGIAATWTEDVCTYSFIWAVFMGAGAMVYEKRHFAFTSIMDMMKNQKAMIPTKKRTCQTRCMKVSSLCSYLTFPL